MLLFMTVVNHSEMNDRKLNNNSKKNVEYIAEDSKHKRIDKTNEQKTNTIQLTPICLFHLLALFFG